MNPITRRTALGTALAGAAALLAPSVSLRALAAEEKKMWAKSFLGKKAPALVVEKWLGPEPQREGRWLLVDFWATWCGPCRKAIPELNGFHKTFGDRLVVVGISDETEAIVKRMKSPAMDYFRAIDTKGRTKKAFEVTGIPHVVVIDPDGVVRWEGFPFLEGHELTETVLGKLLPAAGTRKP
ncbi:MAG: TlpA family protein disulfide reductase [Verrucomicrobia bacterium]|nr:MAG: TlpA family protein disulfide reductase [Verrucomicrobiota bacterium]